MTTLGSLSIGRKSTSWSKADSDAYLTAAAVGLLAGIAVTYARTPIHLPGHKVLFWLVPALACRLATRARAGATVSVLGTMAATLILGGELAGSTFMMPFVALAGVTLDLTARMVEQRGFSVRYAFPLLALAGVAGNMICFVSHFFVPVGRMFSSNNLWDLLWVALSHAGFGFIAGICGAMVGWGILKFRRRI